MRTALVAVSSGATTQVVAQSECPAYVVFSNVGAGGGAQGRVFFSNEPTAHLTGGGIPLDLNRVLTWGQCTKPLYAYCVGEITEILVTFADRGDEIHTA